MHFLVFYVTFPDEATASSICKKMVDSSLAACANIVPIQSVYWWEGAVQQEGEIVGILKTRIELEDALEKAVSDIHPYEVPCLMRFEVRANQAYVDWIYENTVLQ